MARYWSVIATKSLMNLSFGSVHISPCHPWQHKEFATKNRSNFYKITEQPWPLCYCKPWTSNHGPRINNCNERMIQVKRSDIRFLVLFDSVNILRDFHYIWQCKEKRLKVLDSCTTKIMSVEHNKIEKNRGN